MQARQKSGSRAHNGHNRGNGTPYAGLVDLMDTRTCGFGFGETFIS